MFSVVKFDILAKLCNAFWQCTITWVDGSFHCLSNSFVSIVFWIHIISFYCSSCSFISIQESERSCICVLGVLMLPLSVIFLMDFGNVPMVWYFLFFIFFPDYYVYSTYHRILLVDKKFNENTTLLSCKFIKNSYLYGLPVKLPILNM